MNSVRVGLAIVIAASVAVAADSPISVTYRIKVLAYPEFTLETKLQCDGADLAEDLKAARISEQVAQIRQRLRDLACAKSN